MQLGIDAGNFARDRRGMGRVARAIAQAALDARDTETTFLLERRGDERGVRNAFAEHAICVEAARSAQQRSRFDVVWFPWNGMRFRAVAPTLVTVNDAFAFTYAHPQGVARRREQRPILRGTREATRIVTCSRWSRIEIVREMGADPSRIDVIPYAPDSMFVPGNDDPLLRAWRYVLMVGVRERRKNARVVIEACAAAFSSPIDMLAIVGTVAPDDRRRMEALGVRHRLLGDVDDATLRTLYRNARAVAVPSLAEGFGLVAVEALACGAAVLAADSSALPDATRGAALLLDPLDVALWRDTVARVLRDDIFQISLAARGASCFGPSERDAPSRAYLDLLRRLARA